MNATKAKAIGLKSAHKPIGLRKKEIISDRNEEALFIGEADDTTYDEALVGGIQKPCGEYVACYDYEKCIDCLVRHQGMNRGEAVEFFNVEGAYVGENGPVFLYLFDHEELTSDPES